MKNSMNNIVKNTAPAIAVMVVGLVGAYFVYDSYFSDRVSSGFVASIEPAAGETTVYEHESDVEAVVNEEEGVVVFEEEVVIEGEETLTEEGVVVEEDVVVEEGVAGEDVIVDETTTEETVIDETVTEETVTEESAVETDAPVDGEEEIVPEAGSEELLNDSQDPDVSTSHEM